MFSGEGFLLPDCDPVMKRSIIFTNAMNDHYKRSEDRVEAIYKKFEQVSRTLLLAAENYKFF